VADWTEFPPSVFLPGEPITSPQGLGLFENVEAQAEGAPNAPRNRPLSMDILIGGQSFEMSDTTPVNFVDLAGLSSLILVYFAGTYNGQVGFSTDNGLNWSAYFSLPNLADGTVERTSHYINLVEGRINFGAALTGAAGANAIRVRFASGTLTGRVAIYGLGRT
jgi:hypothetical protein